MTKPEFKARLWLPWKYNWGGQEIRLSSDDVYETLNEARKGLFFLAESRGADVEIRISREKHIEILKAIEDGLGSMFSQAMKDTPKMKIPGGKK